jgi:hypothetical protein
MKATSSRSRSTRRSTLTAFAASAASIGVALFAVRAGAGAAFQLEVA